MKTIIEKPQFKQKTKNVFHNALVSLKKVFVPLIIMTGTCICSSLMFSFSILDSSRALLDESAILCANVAKDNYYQKVHIATKMPFKEGIENRNFNVSSFTKSQKEAHNAFLSYSSAAFVTRNNFYSIPIDEDNDGDFVYKKISYNFGNQNLDCINISAPTNSVVGKKTVCKKKTAEAIAEIEIDKLRLETIDLYMCSSENGKNTGIPVFVPDFVAEEIVESSDYLNNILDCVGLAGTININGSIQNIYIKNIIATKEYKNDENIITQVPITASNTKYASFLRDVYGSFTVLFHTELYSENQCIACADFDSEFFKIKNYFDINLRKLYSKDESFSYVYSYELNENLYTLKTNLDITNKLNKLLRMNVQNINYFDGNLLFLLVGLFACIVAFIYIYFTITSYLKKNAINYNETFYLLIAPLISFIALNLLAVLFIFIFKSNSLFISYTFSTIAISSFLASALGVLGILSLWLILRIMVVKK